MTGHGASLGLEDAEPVLEVPLGRVQLASLGEEPGPFLGDEGELLADHPQVEGRRAALLARVVGRPVTHRRNEGLLGRDRRPLVLDLLEGGLGVLDLPVEFGHRLRGRGGHHLLLVVDPDHVDGTGGPRLEGLGLNRLRQPAELQLEDAGLQVEPGRPGHRGATEVDGHRLDRRLDDDRRGARLLWDVLGEPRPGRPDQEDN